MTKVGEEDRKGLRPARADEQPREHRQQLRRRHADHDRRPDPAPPWQHHPPGDQQRQQRRRHQAAAQVVENLPAADRGQRIALEPAPRRHEREQPEQDLPVPSHPPVLAPRMRQHARRVVVYQLDVRHQPDARVQPFEQVVRQERVLRHRVLERLDEGIDVIQALAGEDPLGEQVLVGVGHRGGIGVDAGVAGIQAGEQRAGRAHEVHADAGLQDAVALGDPAHAWIEDGAVERVHDEPDQLARHAARQPEYRCRA